MKNEKWQLHKDRTVITAEGFEICAPTGTAQSNQLIEHPEPGYYRMITKAERTANLKLIAAAPELLEACKEMMHAVENYNDYDKALAMIQGAIDKATNGGA